MINLSTKAIAAITLAAQLCKDKYKLQAVQRFWPETLLLHQDVPKMIQYPTFGNTCALDPSCEDCSPLSEIQIACRGCQTTSAVTIQKQNSIMIHGATSGTTHFDLELVAIWPDGTEKSVQRMKVNFVDPLCQSSHFTDLENPLLRADFGSKKTVSQTLGPFLDPADVCGGRVFSVIGKCLSLTRDGDSVVVSLNQSDHGECQTPGIYQGGLIISFDRFNNGRSIVNFNYALDCNPVVELVGSDASDHSYIQGGPNLYVNLGTWTLTSDCGGRVSSNLRYQDQTAQDWFKFDQNSKQLQIFGHPKKYVQDHFEFIYEAILHGKVMASSVFSIKLIRKSSDLTKKVASPSLARKPRKLGGTSSCLSNNFPDAVTISEFDTHFAFSYPSNPSNCCYVTPPPPPPSYTSYDPANCNQYNFQYSQTYYMAYDYYTVDGNGGSYYQNGCSGYSYYSPPCSSYYDSSSCTENNSCYGTYYYATDYYNDDGQGGSYYYNGCSGYSYYNPPPCSSYYDSSSCTENNSCYGTYYTSQDYYDGCGTYSGCYGGYSGCYYNYYYNYYDGGGGGGGGAPRRLDVGEGSRRLQNAISCTIGSQGPWNEVTLDGTNLNFDYNSANSNGGSWTVNVNCNCADNGASYSNWSTTLTVVKSCTSNNSMILQYTDNQTFTMSTSWIPYQINAFQDAASNSQSTYGSPYYCGPRSCSYSVFLLISGVLGACPSSDCQNMVYWDSASQTFSIVYYSVPGTYIVTLTCLIGVLPQISMTLTVTVPAPTDPCLSASMVTPTLPPINVPQSYTPTTIAAFGDTTSGSSSPPTCLARACTSNNPNVVWNNASQLFTVQSLATDVTGISTVTLTCSLTSYSAVPAISQTFSLTTETYCVTGNAITLPTLPPLTIDQSYVSTTIPAFGDTISATSSPPTCGARTCSSTNPKVVWNNANQLFDVQTLQTSDVAGTTTVTITCWLTNYSIVSAVSQTFLMTIVAAASCSTGNAMTVPTLPAINVPQSYTPTTISAFGDAFSGATSPPTCLARTCMSDNPNVIWNNASQLFTVQSLTTDVTGILTVTLTCSLTSYPAVPAASQTFSLTTETYCVTGNAITIPTLAPLTIDSSYVSTTIPAFSDTISGATSPPTCGARTCSSTNLKVAWNNASQLFDVQTLQTTDIAGTSTVTITCWLTNYSAVSAVSQTFLMTIVAAASCSTGNAMTLPTLAAINVPQSYTPTTISAFGDAFSGATSPPTCLARTCTSDNPNVIWDNPSQLFTVQALTTDVAATSTVTLTCSLASYPTVLAISQSFVLTTAAYCVTGNAMTLPTLPAMTVDQSYVPTTIPALGDTISAATSPPTCGARTCSSTSPNVIWNNASQLFTVQSLSTDVVGTSTVTLTCSLTNYPAVLAASPTFSLTIPASSCSVNAMTVPTLATLSINQNSAATTIPAFSDLYSGATSPPTCLARTCTSDNLNVIWNDASQSFSVQPLITDVAGAPTVTLTCSLAIYTTVPASSAIFVLTTATYCITGNTMISPTLAALSINQNYVPTTIPAFADVLSASSSPPSCGARTCTSSDPHVVWDNVSQFFTVSQISGDVAGSSSSVILTCQLTNYSVTAITSTLTLNFSVDCLTANSITVPTLPPVTIDQTYVPTTIAAFGDATSGTTNLPTCGPRTCSSNNPNVVWDNVTQLFTLQSLTTDVVGVYSVSLTCSITSDPSVSGSSSFLLTIQLCILTSATVTGTPQGGTQIDYYIADPGIGYVITVTFLPANCVYTSFVPDIQTAAGASTSTFATISTATITINTADFSLAGLINMRWWFTPTVNPSQPPIYFNFVLNLINPCLIWSPPTMSPSSLVASILGPSQISATTSFFPSRQTTNAALNCGLVTYVTIPAQPSYLTIDMVGLQISVLATATDAVATTNFILRSTSNNWPATVDLPFTVQITPCAMTSVAGIDLITGSITKTIFQAATPYTITTYTQTPACGYVPQYVVQTTQQLPTVGQLIISPPFWLLNAANMVVQLQSNDPALDGTTYNAQLLVTIDVMQLSQTLAVTWVDPCKTTTFVAAAIADSFGFIVSPAIAVNVPVPWLNDQANISFGGSQTQSICNTQSFVAKENGQIPPYITISFDTTSGQNFMKFSTTNTLMAGPHVITVTYSLNMYPTIINTATFNFVFYLLVAPVPPATTTYQVTSPTLDIPISNFQVSPVNPSMVITYNASLDSGGVLPVFIVFSETGSGLTASRKLTVNTVSNSSVGTYQILMTVAFSLVPQPVVIQTLTFTLQVTAAPVLTTIQTNIAPFFTSPLGGPFEFQYGNPWLPTYKLPQTLDPEGQTVTITVNYGTASSFLTYNGSLNEFKMTATTAQDIGNHSVTVIVSDPEGKSTTYSFLLKILDQPVAQQIVATATAVSNQASQIASSSTSSQQQSNTQIVLVAYNFDVVTTPISYQSTDLLTLASYAASQFPAIGETTGTGFDWMNAFKQLLNPKEEKNASKYPDPQVSVSSISNSGKVILSFTNKMYVPPLDQINKAAFPAANNARMLSKTVDKVRALQVRAIPGSNESFKQNLTLNYNITSFKERSMEISIYFDHALAISSNKVPDEVEIKFPGNFYFFDTRGNVLPMNTALKYRLPKQMPDNAATRAAAEVAVVASTTTNLVMTANLALNIVLSASLQQLWSMVNTQQIVVLMPLWTVKLPGNAAMFYGFVMQIAAFDVIPTGDFYDKVLPDMPQTDPINENFDAVGFSSMYFLYNSGSIMISIVAVPLLALIVGILRPCIRYRYPLCLYRKLKSYVFWNGTFQTITGTFTILVMCVLINTKHVSFLSLIILANLRYHW